MGHGKAETKKNSWVSWSEDEVKLLKRLFPLGRAREIEQVLEKTKNIDSIDFIFR
jgi:hypothetical protein